MSKLCSSANLSSFEVLNANLAKFVKLAEIVTDLILSDSVSIDDSLSGLLLDSIEFLKYNSVELSRFEDCLRAEDTFVASTAKCPTFVHNVFRGDKIE